MVKLILLFIILVTASLGFNWLNDNSGSVEFNWLGYQVETSIPFVIVAILIAFFLISIISQFVARIFGVPTFFKGRAQQKFLDKSLANISSSYAALLSGDIEQARLDTNKLKKLTNRNDGNKEVNRIVKMLDAKISQEEGNLMIADHTYQELLEDKNNEYFSIKGMLDSAFKSGDVEKSIVLAEKAFKLKPNIKNGAHSLLELYKKVEDWNKAEDFLIKYRKSHYLRDDKYNHIDVQKELAFIWYNQARIKNDDNIPASKEFAFNLLEKALKNDPQNELFLLEYIRVAKDLIKDRKIKNKVESFWKNKQSFDVLKLYIDSIKGKDEKSTLKSKLKAIETIAKIKPSDAIDLVRNSLVRPEIIE